jgi:hypothetical protein
MKLNKSVGTSMKASIVEATKLERVVLVNEDGIIQVRLDKKRSTENVITYNMYDPNEDEHVDVIVDNKANIITVDDQEYLLHPIKKLSQGKLIIIGKINKEKKRKERVRNVLKFIVAAFITIWGTTQENIKVQQVEPTAVQIPQAAFFVNPVFNPLGVQGPLTLASSIILEKYQNGITTNNNKAYDFGAKVSQAKIANYVEKIQMDYDSRLHVISDELKYTRKELRNQQKDFQNTSTSLKASEKEINHLTDKLRIEENSMQNMSFELKELYKENKQLVQQTSQLTSSINKLEQNISEIKVQDVNVINDLQDSLKKLMYEKSLVDSKFQESMSFLQKIQIKIQDESKLSQQRHETEIVSKLRDQAQKFENVRNSLIQEYTMELNLQTQTHQREITSLEKSKAADTAQRRAQAFQSIESFYTSLEPKIKVIQLPNGSKKVEANTYNILKVAPQLKGTLTLLIKNLERELNDKPVVDKYIPMIKLDFTQTVYTILNPFGLEQEYKFDLELDSYSNTGPRKELLYKIKERIFVPVIKPSIVTQTIVKTRIEYTTTRPIPTATSFVTHVNTKEALAEITQTPSGKVTIKETPHTETIITIVKPLDGTLEKTYISERNLETHSKQSLHTSKKQSLHTSKKQSLHTSKKQSLHVYQSNIKKQSVLASVQYYTAQDSHGNYATQIKMERTSTPESPDFIGPLMVTYSVKVEMFYNRLLELRNARLIRRQGFNPTQEVDLQDLTEQELKFYHDDGVFTVVYPVESFRGTRYLDQLQLFLDGETEYLTDNEKKSIYECSTGKCPPITSAVHIQNAFNLINTLFSLGTNVHIPPVTQHIIFQGNNNKRYQEYKENQQPQRKQQVQQNQQSNQQSQQSNQQSQQSNQQSQQSIQQSQQSNQQSQQSIQQQKFEAQYDFYKLHGHGN